MKEIGWIGLWLTALLWLPNSAGAANLIVNGDFDQSQQLSGWMELGSKSWSSFDEDGITGSGSVLINHDFQFSGALLVRQCVPAAGLESYLAGTSAYVASGQTAIGQAELHLIFYPSTDCSGGASEFNVVGISSQLDLWERHESVFVAPAGVQSARVSLVCNKSQEGGTLECFHDNVFLPEPSANWMHVAALGTLALVSRLRARSA